MQHYWGMRQSLATWSCVDGFGENCAAVWTYWMALCCCVDELYDTLQLCGRAGWHLRQMQGTAECLSKVGYQNKPKQNRIGWEQRKNEN